MIIPDRFLEEISMGVIIAFLFLMGVFLFCALIASWFVDGSAAIAIVAILIMASIFAWSSPRNKKK